MGGKGQVKRGGVRIIYVDVVIAARVHLICCIANPEAREDVPDRILTRKPHQQTRLTEMGAGWPTAGFGRKGLPHGHSESASRCPAGAGKLIRAHCQKQHYGRRLMLPQSTPGPAAILVSQWCVRCRTVPRPARHPADSVNAPAPSSMARRPQSRPGRDNCRCGIAGGSCCMHTLRGRNVT